MAKIISTEANGTEVTVTYSIGDIIETLSVSGCSSVEDVQNLIADKEGRLNLAVKLADDLGKVTDVAAKEVA